MASDEQGEKTEAPTQRRRDEARQRGQVARSTDLSSAAVLMGALLALNALGGRMFRQMANVMVRLLEAPENNIYDIGNLSKTVSTCLISLAMVLLPMLVVTIVAAVVSNLGQVGLHLTTEPLKPEWSKISPIAGFKRLFSKRSLVRLGMSLGKVILISFVAYLTVRDRMNEIVGSAGLGYTQILAVGAELTYSLALRMGLVLLALALLDYLFQRWQHEQDLRMTREELKEDLKRMEGDPMIRSRRQRVARQLAMQRMGLEVPHSTVVVTNPTHLAIALVYKEGMAAPKVVAKGADYLALRIRQIAAANGVPIVERKPLAQALYKTTDIGQEIPVNLYKAVAEVLAYVYELAKHKKIGRRIPVGV